MNSSVHTVRAFNRLYTGVIGVLGEGLLQTSYSLTEARVIFELGQQPETEALRLRESLGLDAGYLSRLLGRFESDGLVSRARSGADARRQLVRLTASGRELYERLDRRSAAEIQELLDRLPPERRRRLLTSMETIRAVLEPAERSYALRPPQPGDLGWVVHRHGVFYAAERGWDARYEALVAKIVAGYADDHDPVRENGWIAEVDGEPAGSIFCVRAAGSTEVAQLRLLLVEDAARGMGVGTALVEECLRFAREAGYHEIKLWTVAGLEAARRIYERAGFRLESEEPGHSWGHDIVGQWWRMKL